MPVVVAAVIDHPRKSAFTRGNSVAAPLVVAAV